MIESKTKTEWKIINVISICTFHIIAIYAIFQTYFYAKRETIYWFIFTSIIAGFGVTAGVHRLWCHRSYKATTPFRYFLALCYSVAGQNTIYDWVRDHRIHHKFSDTDADPHNIQRGFWFSHVGWLMQTKHKDVITAGKKISMKDIEDDPVVQWHQKYFIILKLLFSIIIPTIIPIYFWNETVFMSIMTQPILRYCFSLNCTWSVNSFAHLYGNKPYNENIYPAENSLIAFFSIGEGWHNYHHVFPWDYKAAESPLYKLNFTTFLLDVAAYFNLVYDRKHASPELVYKTMNQYKNH